MKNSSFGLSSNSAGIEPTSEQASAAPANEQEPLLGGPGDGAQQEGQWLARNLITGKKP